MFKCQSESVVADVYSAFALAFKKPAGIPKEAFFFEVSLEIRENQDSDAYGPAVGTDGSNYDSVPRQKNMFKLKRDVDKKVVITVSQVSKVGKVLLYDFSRHADIHLFFSLFHVEQYCEVDGGALLRSAGVSRPKRPPC